MSKQAIKQLLQAWDDIVPTSVGVDLYNKGDDLMDEFRELVEPPEPDDLDIELNKLIENHPDD
jgi:hypothetical protein